MTELCIWHPNLQKKLAFRLVEMRKGLGMGVDGAHLKLQELLW